MCFAAYAQLFPGAVFNRLSQHEWLSMVLLCQHKLAAGCTADLLLMRLRACRVHAPDNYHIVLHSVVCHGAVHFI